MEEEEEEEEKEEEEERWDLDLRNLRACIFVFKNSTVHLL